MSEQHAALPTPINTGIKWKGEDIMMRKMDQEILVKFSEWYYLRMKEFLKLEARDEGWPAEKLDEEMANNRETYLAGGYGFENPTVQKVMRASAGLVKIFSLTTGLPEDEVLQVMAQHKVDAEQAMKLNEDLSLQKKS